MLIHQATYRHYVDMAEIQGGAHDDPKLPFPNYGARGRLAPPTDCHELSAEGLL